MQINDMCLKKRGEGEYKYTEKENEKPKSLFFMLDLENVVMRKQKINQKSYRFIYTNVAAEYITRTDNALLFNLLSSALPAIDT